MADLHWYHQDEAGSLTWLGGVVLAEGITVKEAVQILANVFRDLPAPGAEYCERPRQMDAGQLRPNHWRAGEKSGAIPQGTTTSNRKAMKQAAQARFRERNLAAGLTAKGWPRVRPPDGKAPPPSERAAKRSLGHEEDERAAAERAAARRAWNAKHRAKKLAAGLTTEGKPRKRAPKKGADAAPVAAVPTLPPSGCSMVGKRGRPPVLPPGEAERRQAERAKAAQARCRERRKAAGLTGEGTPRKRAPNGSPPKPRAPRTEEQKARARERRKAKKDGGEK